MNSLERLNELSYQAALWTQRRQPRCDETITQLPTLTSALSTDMLPIFHNGGTYGIQVGNLPTISSIAANASFSNVGVFNVKYYGAIGDGLTDDTIAIQAAYTACGQNGGGTVLFPYGVYGITASIVRPAVPILTKGVGMGASTLKLLPNANIDNTSMLASASASSPHHCLDITFDMNGANLAAAPTNAQFVAVTNGGILERVECMHRIGNDTTTPSFGIFINENDWTIRSCYFHDDVQTINTSGSIGGVGSQTVAPVSMVGIKVGTVLTVDENKPETVTVSSITASTFTAPFLLTHTGTVSIVGGPTVNDFIGGGSTSLTNLSSRGILADCIFENLLNDAYQRTDAHNDLIIGNRIYNCPVGILVQGGSGHRVLGNVIDCTLVGAQAESTFGLAVTSQSGSPDIYDVEVAHNTVVGTNMGIYPGPSIYGHGFNVHDNTIDGSWGAAISAGNIYDSQIHHNTIRNANSAGYTYQPGGSQYTSGIYLTGGPLSNVEVSGNIIFDDRGSSALMQNGISVDTSATVTGLRVYDGKIRGMKNVRIDVASSQQANVAIYRVGGYNPVGAVTVTPTSHAWTNASMVDVTLYVATAGSYTGTTTITPSGGSAVTVPNAVVGMAYQVPVGATITWGVGGSVTTDPTFDPFGN